jgi:hypothetical protein
LYCRKRTATQLLKSNIRIDSYHDTRHYSLVQGKCSISKSFEHLPGFEDPAEANKVRLGLTIQEKPKKMFFTKIYAPFLWASAQRESQVASLWPFL